MGKFDTIEIDGRKIEVHVNNLGEFTAIVDGEDFKHPTYKGLKEKLSSAIRKNPLSIPCLIQGDNRWDEDEPYVPAVITGIHSGNGNLMVRRKTDKAATQHRPYGHSLLGADTDLKKLKALNLAKLSAVKAYDTFVSDHELSRHSIRKMIEAEESKSK